MNDDNGLKIALSPVQMAAVLSDKSISEGETLSNRLFGGLGLAGGVVEMFGAGAMCVVPEPTMLTKAGCVFVGTHGLDTIQASIRQIWTGRQIDTDSYNSAVALAESLGADKNTAMHVGMSVDLAIPMGFAFAVGAVRVAAIRSGRISINLLDHEALAGSKAGGHTLLEHIGKTSDQLTERLNRYQWLRQAGSFKSVPEAEQLISKVLNDNRNVIKMWVNHVPENSGLRIPLTRSFAHQTGILIKRGSKDAIKCHKVTVVIKIENWHGKPYFILTAFPEV
jgi:hypothetical protein